MPDWVQAIGELLIFAGIIGFIVVVQIDARERKRRNRD